MKKILICFITFWVFAFSSLAQIDTINQEMVSMADTYQKRKGGTYRYFKKEEEKPLTREFCLESMTTEIMRVFKSLKME